MRPMSICLIILVSILLVIPHTTVSGEQLGFVNIELGENKESVIRKLAIYDTVGDDALLFVFTKKDYDWIGSVTFENNRLKTINKQWASYKDISQGKTLLTIIEGYLLNKEEAATISIKQTATPKLRGKTIYIKILTTPTRTIEISIFEFPTHQLSISETIE